MGAGRLFLARAIAGVGTGDGSAGAPFGTVQEGIDAAAAGDVADVGAYEYCPTGCAPEPS